MATKNQKGKQDTDKSARPEASPREEKLETPSKEVREKNKPLTKK